MTSKKLLFHSQKPFDLAKINKIQNHFVKPTGGLWLATWDTSENMSSWESFCFGENFRKETFVYTTEFSLSKNARVSVIDSYQDLNSLVRKYTYETLSYTGCAYLDFEKMAQDFDVVFLTEKGQWDTRFSRPHNLYGWDIESALILNANVIESFKQIEKPIFQETEIY